VHDEYSSELLDLVPGETALDGRNIGSDLARRQLE